MAPQTSIPLAANVLGEQCKPISISYRTSGRSHANSCSQRLWCIQLIPQIWKSWRRSSTEGLTGLMFILWFCACPSFGAYAIIQNFNVPLQIQPNVMCGLCLIGWGQTLYYHNRLSTWKVVLMVFAAGSFCAAIELLIVFTIKPAYGRGVEWPILLIGVLSTVLILAGLVLPYFELAKRRGRVVGISLRFLTIDIAGAAFSLLALVVQNTFDILGGVLYILVMVMEIGIVGSQVVWFVRTRHVHKAARNAGLSYDEFVESSKQTSCAASNRSFEHQNDPSPRALAEKVSGVISV